jgi:multiple sugar transport system permease protein
MTEAVAAIDTGASRDVTERLSWDSRARRFVTIYLPLTIFVVVLLFPFYWMVITSIKPDDEMYDYKQFSPFWVAHPTLHNFRVLLFETEYPHWLLITMTVAVCATVLSVFCSVMGAYAIARLRFRGAQGVGLAIYFAYMVPPSILFIPLASVVFQLGLYDNPLALILTYPTFLIPFCTWLLIGYFKSIPYELEECALIDGASRLQILWRITLPLAVPGADLGRHLRVHAVVERVHLCAGVHPVVGEQDGSGGDPDRAGDGGCVSVGLADGGVAARLAAGGDLLFVLCGILRLEPDGRGEGVGYADQERGDDAGRCRLAHVLLPEGHDRGRHRRLVGVQ